MFCDIKGVVDNIKRDAEEVGSNLDYDFHTTTQNHKDNYFLFTISFTDCTVVTCKCSQILYGKITELISKVKGLKYMVKLGKYTAAHYELAYFVVLGPNSDGYYAGVAEFADCVKPRYFKGTDVFTYKDGRYQKTGKMDHCEYSPVVLGE